LRTAPREFTLGVRRVDDVRTIAAWAERQPEATGLVLSAREPTFEDAYLASELAGTVKRKELQ